MSASEIANLQDAFIIANQFFIEISLDVTKVLFIVILTFWIFRHDRYH